MQKLAAAALAFWMALPAAGTPIVDQKALPDGGVLMIDNDTTATQNFVAGQTGILTRLDLWIAAPTDCSLWGCSLYITHSGGSVGRTWEIDRVITEAGWVPFELLTPLAVNAGDALWFNISVIDVLAVGQSTYSGGDLVYECYHEECVDPFSYPTLQWTILPNTSMTLPVDFAFRSWIAPTPAIPEPSAVLAFAVGLLTIAWRLAAPRT